MLHRSRIVSAAEALGLGPALHKAVLCVRQLQSVPGRMRWKRELRRFTRRGVTFDRLYGNPTLEALPVILCLWNRPSRIEAQLKQLAAQSSPIPLRVMLWNNQPADDRYYRDAIAAMENGGSIASIEYFCSGTNIGGIARFVAARHTRESGYLGPFIMLDDDQDVSHTFVADMIAAYTPRTYAGWWVWRMDDSYWARTEVLPGDSANYVGTGGSICDSELVGIDRFFTTLPVRYGFLEDIWASAWATQLGWRMTKVDTEIAFVMSELDQAHALADLKREFFEHLRSKRGKSR